MRTTTLAPFDRLRTRTRDPNGSVRWPAVKELGSAISPFAVRPRSRYQTATPFSCARAALVRRFRSRLRRGCPYRVEQPVDQASLNQPAPAPKSSKQNDPKTTVKKPVLRDGAKKEQRHAKAVAAPETKDQAIATNQEPATADVQEPPRARALPNPISKLRELFGGQ
jgi:hypothetical protein